jgi:hypothetical protein
MASRSIIPFIALAALASAAAPAHAASFVYGGTTSGGDPIAITAAKGGQALRGATISWTATCDDQTSWLDSAVLTPVRPSPSFPPGPEDLVTSSNGKGRFAGLQTAARDAGDDIAAIVVTVKGKLTKTRAGGTLSAVVKLVNKTTQASDGACQTGTVRWSATRAPGSIFAGSTSQHEPVVVRVRHKRVSDFLVSWDTATCSDGSFWRYSPDVGNFPLSGSGAFGDAFSHDEPMDGGVTRKVAVDLRGRATKTSSRGTLHVTTADTDATGAQTMTCDSGTIGWKAITG